MTNSINWFKTRRTLPDFVQKDIIEMSKEMQAGLQYVVVMITVSDAFNV